MEKINFEKNVEEIKRKIVEGDFDTACVQLHGLIYLFPKEVFLREMLAEVYAKLGDDVNAGRYWYLVENKTPEMEEACKTFEERNNPFEIFLLMIDDFKNDKDNVIGTSAEKPLRELQKRLAGWRIDPPMDFFEEREPLTESEERQNEWFARGCLVAIFIILVLAIIGLVTLLTLLK